MSTTRGSFLSNLKLQLNNTLLPDAAPQHPGPFQDYTYNTEATPNQLLEMFTQELEALSGHVLTAENEGEAVSHILDILKQYSATRIITWNDESMGLPALGEALAAAGVAPVDSALPPEDAQRKAKLVELEDVRAGITGALGGLADTGAIALVSSPGQGRLASLLPPVHIALLKKSSLYPAMPAFLAAHPTVATAGSNLVFIAGPSRTGDIEMTLSLGVHGPKEVYVIVVQK